MKLYLAENEIRFYTINAMQLAMEVGLGGRINTAMETAFFYLANIIPTEEILPILKEEALKSYRHKSMAIVEKNQAAIDRTIELLQEIPCSKQVGNDRSAGKDIHCDNTICARNRGTHQPSRRQSTKRGYPRKESND